MTITITIRKNGPYFISPEDAPSVRLVDHEGNTLPPRPEGKPISLCRCGASSNKPYCDSTHKTNGFVGTEAPRATVEAVQSLSAVLPDRPAN